MDKLEELEKKRINFKYYINSNPQFPTSKKDLLLEQYFNMKKEIRNLILLEERNNKIEKIRRNNNVR